MIILELVVKIIAICEVIRIVQNTIQLLQNVIHFKAAQKTREAFERKSDSIAEEISKPIFDTEEFKRMVEELEKNENESKGKSSSVS